MIKPISSVMMNQPRFSALIIEREDGVPMDPPVRLTLTNKTDEFELGTVVVDGEVVEHDNQDVKTASQGLSPTSINSRGLLVAFLSELKDSLTTWRVSERAYNKTVNDGKFLVTSEEGDPNPVEARFII